MERGKPLTRAAVNSSKQGARARKRIKPVSDKARAQWDAERIEREAVFARDRVCQLRGVDGAGACFGSPTFQHILKASQGGKYTRENGAQLCSSHNDRLEADADLAELAHGRGLVVYRKDLLELAAWIEAVG